MTTVTITRTTQQYRRACNGPWIGNGEATETFTEVPEEKALDYVKGGGLSSSCIVTWPDNHAELFYHDSRSYLVGPGSSRLRPGGPHLSWAWYVNHP